MMDSRELLAGLLDGDVPGFVTWDDLAGRMGPALRRWQQAGFLASVPAHHAAAPCPHCDDGSPARVGGAWRCNVCGSVIDERHTQLWAFDRHGFLRWLATHWRLRGESRRVGDHLWQLGTRAAEHGSVEYFYRRPGPLNDNEATRLAAFLKSLVLHGRTAAARAERESVRHRCLVELLPADGSLRIADPGDQSVGMQHRIRFDQDTGGLWDGMRLLGEVPVNSREYHLLACLASRIDAYVPYADLKREVLRRSGGRDGTEEATFCHGLKRRVKKRIPGIDQVVLTNNKGDGYRLRGHL